MEELASALSFLGLRLSVAAEPLHSAIETTLVERVALTSRNRRRYGWSAGGRVCSEGESSGGAT
jgi:hypothetical protein